MLREDLARAYARAMRAFIAILFLAALPGTGAAAGSSYTIDELVSGEANMMIEFDRAAKAMFHPRCQCYVYLQGGEVKEAKLPLDHATRKALIKNIMRGLVIPIPPKEGPAF